MYPKLKSLLNRNSIESYFVDSKLETKIQTDVKAIELPIRRKSNKFTEERIKEIMTIRNAINEISQKEISDFFKVGLSSTIYSCFETRSKKFSIMNTFSRKIQNMIIKMEQFNLKINGFENR